MELGVASLEVRSRKLDYLTGYRALVRDIAAESMSVLLQSFAASEQRLTPDLEEDPVSAYQRFRLLRSIVSDRMIQGAIEAIVSRPHTEWIDAALEGTFSGRVTYEVARQLVTAKRRRPWPKAHVGELASLPERVTSYRALETVDTAPNRVVKFILDNWLRLVDKFTQMAESVEGEHAKARARREVADFARRIAEFRSHSLFSEVGDLTTFPENNQVLLRRPGYRELIAAHAMMDAGASLECGVPETALSAGQRDISKLFEYWVYLWVRNVIATLCETFDDRPLVGSGQLGGGLRSARKGVAKRLGRVLDITLYFNRSFAGSSENNWSGAGMRPDISIQVALEEGWADATPMWIHFDAKYRLDTASQIFDGADDEQLVGVATRDDILKMHAYRDAVRDSSGAYVIFPGPPGSPPTLNSQYDELLPGLGAFPLSPGPDGPPSGLEALRSFVDDVLTHYASTISSDRRARYWLRRANAEEPRLAPQAAGAKLPRPPADVLVLLGYVRGGQHLRWIHRERRYNIRAGEERGAVGLEARELACEFVLLHGVGDVVEVWSVAGPPEIWTRGKMMSTNYPRSPRNIYFCYPLGEQVDLGFPRDAEFVSAQARSLTRFHGEPVAVSVTDLLRIVMG